MDATAASRIKERPLKECTEAIGNPAGIEEAAETLLELGRRGRVGIVCDYDVDGASSQAILVETLRAVLPPESKDPVVAVPYRNTEGFGPNPRCLNRLSEEGVSCVAVVDCGTASGRLLDQFHASYGIVPVVVDHHPPHHQQPPEAGILVNPWVSQAPDPGELGSLCAAGLAWFLARAMLRQAGLNAQDSLTVRRRITLLAALGTSCDMMPVNTPFNRALIHAGVRLLNDPTAVSPGLAAIMQAAGLKGTRTADDFGWRVGPRINAGSRMGESELAARCLRAKSMRSARDLAQQLHDLNHQRVDLGRKASKELDESVGLEALMNGPVNVHLAEAATPGTVGLVASSLVNRFGWPAIAVARRKDGLLAGSGRSALGFDLGSAVSAAVQEGILASGGGHAAACGVTFEPTRLEDLRTFLLDRFRELEPEAGASPEPAHEIDAELRQEHLSADAMLEFALAQRRLEPWGTGMPAPLLGIRRCTLAGSKMTQTGHLFMTLESGGSRCSAVWWRAPQDCMEQLGQNGSGAGGGAAAHGEPIDVVGPVELDEWQGRRQGRLVVRDARRSDS